MDLNTLKQESQALKPILQIGKKGMTDSVMIEVEKLFKKRTLVKVKILNNCPIEDKGALVDLIVEKSRAILVSHVGNVFTIYRRGYGNKRPGKKKVP
jgi:RNA-binding protein